MKGEGRTAAALVAVLLLCANLALAQAPDEEDVYGEDALPEYRPEPGSEWKELAVQLPSYPEASRLIEVELSLRDFPFTLFIDPDSLSVGKDRVIRYTAVLRSRTGAENISYEGIRCKNGMVKRYAYGSNGRFRLRHKPEWRYIEKLHGPDRYRRELVDHFFCPLPTGNLRKELLKRLKAGRSGLYMFSDD
ncbi:MAG TPA: hypothetical protein ENK05_11860 [Gammaproteobacteria bacterium]|nr:hypothetical protein [Gammaproteobacteria bacterium]